MALRRRTATDEHLQGEVNPLSAHVLRSQSFGVALVRQNWHESFFHRRTGLSVDPETERELALTQRGLRLQECGCCDPLVKLSNAVKAGSGR